MEFLGVPQFVQSLGVGICGVFFHGFPPSVGGLDTEAA